ncbi:MAG TPA: transglycosylase family protein [Acidimicrobiales bacterium]|nr:transglycosylase family protein [Acidimicrobiales bacterium]
MPDLAHIAKLVRAGSASLISGARLGKRTMVGITVAVVLFGAPALTARAAADPIGATRSAIASLQAQAAAGASRIHSLTEAYDQANVQAMALAAQVTQDQVELGQLQQQVDASRTALQKEAILSYTGGSTEVSSSVSGVSDPAVRAEYIQVAAGDLTQAEDQYRTQQVQLATAEANLKKQQGASEAAVNAMAAARQQALAQAASEQAQLDQLQGHLNQLVEAAAVAAARPPAPPTQGLPVNNGVVRVVQTMVSQPQSAPAPAPAPAPSPAPAPVSPAPPVTSGGGAGGVWLQLRECESGDNYQANTGNGFYGAYQFSAQTWADLGYPGRPDLEPPAMQDAAAMKLQAEAGWGQWPACAAALGLT